VLQEQKNWRGAAAVFRAVYAYAADAGFQGVGSVAPSSLMLSPAPAPPAPAPAPVPPPTLPTPPTAPSFVTDPRLVALSPTEMQDESYLLKKQQQHPALLRYYQQVLKAIHEGFLVSGIFATGQIGMEIGSIPTMYRTLYALLSSIPFAATVLTYSRLRANASSRSSSSAVGLSSSGTDLLTAASGKTKKGRKAQYLHIGYLLTSVGDAVESISFARALALRLTVVNESDIIAASKGTNNTEQTAKVSKTRHFLYASTQTLRMALGPVGATYETIMDGLLGATNYNDHSAAEIDVSVQLIALADAKMAIDFITSGGLNEALQSGGGMGINNSGGGEFSISKWRAKFTSPKRIGLDVNEQEITVAALVGGITGK
jgi:hypothetical protein